ncbi:hypothetical protein Gotur_017697 [Gossypium turneri]
MHGPPSPLVENYLREAGFWHVATVGRGCKLDPKLISALVEREQCPTSFWALFRRKLMEVGSRWASYETHSRIQMMIQPK